MSIPIPNRLPDASWPLLKSRLEMAGHDVASLLREKLFVVFIRGLFSRSIGKPGNDISADDDGTYVVTTTSGEPSVLTFNGNTDSSRYGWNPGAGKYMASVKPGRYKMRSRMHRGKYRAFGQDGSPITVRRIKSDGTVACEETGDFGIDWHPHSPHSTNSEGCLTNPADQWQRAKQHVEHVAGRDWFPVVLIERAGDEERFV